MQLIEVFFNIFLTFGDLRGEIETAGVVWIDVYACFVVGQRRQLLVVHKTYIAIHIEVSCYLVGFFTVGKNLFKLAH